MSESLDYVRNMRTACTLLATAADAIRRTHDVAQARGYDQWQDVDLIDTGYTRNDLLALLYLADDLSAFLSNGAPAQADRWPVINKYRSDV